MAKVITFSRHFPAYHPKAGQPTFFVEKILDNAEIEKNNDISIRLEFLYNTTGNHPQKLHTIRGGNRWKAGDVFSPRVWSGKPYNSPQIQFAKDIEIKKVWKFQILNGLVFIDGESFNYQVPKIITLAENDGLTLSDLLCWFQYPKEFSGQIICWSNDVNY